MTCRPFILATMLASAVPALAHANGAPATTVQAISEDQAVVSFADLDLRERGAQRALKLRLMRASEELCIRTEGKVNVDQYMGGKENSCASRTYRLTRDQVATAIARAERGEQLPSMAVVVSRGETAR